MELLWDRFFLRAFVRHLPKGRALPSFSCVSEAFNDGAWQRNTKAGWKEPWKCCPMILPALCLFWLPHWFWDHKNFITEVQGIKTPFVLSMPLVPCPPDKIKLCFFILSLSPFRHFKIFAATFTGQTRLGLLFQNSFRWAYYRVTLADAADIFQILLPKAVRCLTSYLVHEQWGFSVSEACCLPPTILSEFPFLERETKFLNSRAWSPPRAEHHRSLISDCNSVSQLQTPLFSMSLTFHALLLLYQWEANHVQGLSNQKAAENHLILKGFTYKVLTQHTSQPWL